MKKVIPLLCAATIFSAPFSAYAQTAETEPPTEVNQPTEEQPAEVEQVEKLTLEDVIKRGIESNKNLTVLQLNLEASKNELLDTQFDENDVQRDIKDLEDKLDDLKDERKNLEDTASKIMNGQERIAIQNSLDALKDQIQALQLAIKQLETGQIQLQLQEEEAKEGVRLMLTSAYTNILVLEEQMDFTKKTLETAKSNVRKAERMYEFGMVSSEAIRQAKIAQTDLEKQLEELEKNYNQTVATLCFNIGVTYNPAITIEPIEYKAIEVTKPENYSSLIDNTYQVKKAEKNLESAIIARDDAYREYEEDDNVGAEVSKYELEQHDYKVEAAKETILSIKDDIEKTMDQLYRTSGTSYFNYEEALRKLEDVNKDLKVLKTRYKLGVISKHDYESALVKLDQAKLNVYNATVQNYMNQEQIKAFENGYVQ
ncbi:TolC family protein [Peribacillus asahii]|uniref:TolC family protein n=1 Tax=Peribacillus asahii TaxID=228899 RepID=UPI003807AE7A